jgi:hypothetical protein
MSHSITAVSPNLKSTPATSLSEEPAKSTRDNIPLKEIETAIRSIRHGVVQIIIQDGIVIQIDRTEKVRLR